MFLPCDCIPALMRGVLPFPGPGVYSCTKWIGTTTEEVCPFMRTGMKSPPRESKPGEDEKESGIEVFGTVVEKFRAGMFSLQLEGGQTVLATLAGRLRRNRIKVMNGDRVTVELSPYDLSKGRITYRHK